MESDEVLIVGGGQGARRPPMPRTGMLHRHHHVSTSNTALGHIVDEPVDGESPPTGMVEGTSTAAQAMIDWHGRVRDAASSVIERERSFAELIAFEALARDAELTAAQFSIGCGPAKRPIIVSLPCAVNGAHLADGLAAEPIAPDLVDGTDTSFPPGALAGARYAAFSQVKVDTEACDDEQLDLGEVW